MHQQVRVSTTKTGSGPGAMAADEGGLLDLLQVLEDGGINLRTAGGRDLDRGGKFVFGVDDGVYEKARDLLHENGYRDAEIVDVRECRVSDEPGQLRQCIRDLHTEGLEVDEIFVGTPNQDDGSIPIQITTRRGDGKSASAR